MADMKEEAAPGYPTLSAQQVADAFVLQYYHILRVSPENLHKFYKDCSIMAHPGSDGTMVSATTMEGINDAVKSYIYKGCDPIVEVVHAQESVMGSIIVGVTGTLTDKENIKRKFAQTYILVPQETGGFYVHNDILHILDVVEPKALLSDPPEVPQAVPRSPTVLSPQNSEVVDVLNDEQATLVVLDPTPKEAFETFKRSCNPSSPRKKMELPVQIPEDTLKKVSYASVLTREGPLSAHVQVSSPHVADLTKAGLPALSKAASFPINDAPDMKNGLTAEAPKGIHIKDLPPNMTKETLLAEVKKFGVVRPNSLQIREYPEDGYRFAFVEFESAKSARSVVEAGGIWIGGWKFEVQYKRSFNQGANSQGRSIYGRSGYRNDNARSRDGEGHGGRDGEPHGPNWRSSTQDHVRGGSSTATKRNSGSTIRV
ncbi:nuclear transport factor 2-like [Apium graveolens]|uniref:nuclear transport factor 2-like n=1 Tax=Apium graveolens TaxID=4045 RepID=UPI003D7BC0B9